MLGSPRHLESSRDLFPEIGLSPSRAGSPARETAPGLDPSLLRDLTGEDSVVLSEESRRLSDREGAPDSLDPPQGADPGRGSGDDARPGEPSSGERSSGEPDPGDPARDDAASEAESRGAEARSELTEEEEREVRELRARDREVRAHENAHKAAAGDLAAGGPVYEYETGPDGRRYAVGGSVDIRIREGRTPEESLRIALRAQRAALAPAQPSAQDRAVAADAAQRATRARQEIAEERRSERAGGEPQGVPPSGPASATEGASGPEEIAATDGAAADDSQGATPDRLLERVRRTYVTAGAATENLLAGLIA